MKYSAQTAPPPGPHVNKSWLHLIQGMEMQTVVAHNKMIMVHLVPICCFTVGIVHINYNDIHIYIQTLKKKKSMLIIYLNVFDLALMLLFLN